MLMNMSFENLSFYISTSILSVLFIIALYNYLTAPEINELNKNIYSNRLVSVLIPARNEESNINDCLLSVLKQNYKNFEVIVLDDESSDSTYEIVNDISSNNNKVKLFRGKPLPAGWLGKNWACSQLAENSTGEMLLFIDADVRLSNSALSSSMKIFEEKKVNMLSCFPTQKIGTIGERLVVPLMNFFLLSLLPLRKVFSSESKSLTAANGQFILIDKKAYVEIGGHQRVANEVVEDMELARLLKKKGFSILIALGGDSVSCRMYDNFFDSFIGFSKNFFPGFKTNIIFFLILSLFYSAVFLYPVLLLPDNMHYLIPTALIIFIRVFISVRSRQNVILNILLHPVQIIIMLLIAINSVWQNETKNISWKGRKIQNIFMP